MKNVSGYAYFFERKIEINSKIRDIAFLYGTIAHEISHILSHHFIEDNENGERIEHNISKENLRKYEGKAHIGVGVKTLDENDIVVSKFETASMETLIEASSAILYKNRTSAYKSNIEIGYGQISRFIPRLYSAGAGLSDLDIIVSGIHSEDEFTRTLSRNFKGNDLSSALQDIYQIDIAATIMHKILYKDKKLFLDTFFNKKDKGLMNFAIERASSAAYRFACQQIESETRPINDELILELKTRYEKISQSVKQIESDLLNYNLAIFNINKSHQLANEKQLMMNKIYGMYMVNLYKNKIKAYSEDSWVQFSLLAKYGNISQIESILTNDLKIDRETICKNKKEFWKNLKKMEKNKKNPFLEKLKHDDLLDGKQWDNRAIFKVLKEVQKKELNANLKHTPDINDIISTILPCNTTNNFFGIQAIDNLRKHTFKAGKITEQEIKHIYDATKLKTKFEEKIALGNEYRYSQDINYSNKLDKSDKTQIAYTFAHINIEAFDLINELFNDDYGYVINNSVETNKSRLFTSHIGFEKTLKKYDKDSKELYRLKYINKSDYRILKNYKEMIKATERLDNRMLLSFIRIELGDKLDSHNLAILNEAIYNGDFEEKFDNLKESLNISRNIESYRKQFKHERTMFKLKDGAKKLFSKYIFDKNKALPNGNNDSKMAKSLYQSRHASFLKDIKIKNMKQHFEKFVQPSNHDKTKDKGR